MVLKMGDFVVEKIFGWLIPFLLGTAAGGVTLWFTMLRSFRDGLQCLLRAEIIRQNEKWIKAGYCPVYAKQALSREYNAYHGLKGNDVATALYHDVIELPEHKQHEGGNKDEELEKLD